MKQCQMCVVLVYIIWIDEYFMMVTNYRGYLIPFIECIKCGNLISMEKYDQICSICDENDMKYKRSDKRR